jgi:hypothetical protein
MSPYLTSSLTFYGRKKIKVRVEEEIERGGK